MCLNQQILVVGATGRHGMTGAAVARRLRDQGVPVRLLVRRPDAVPSDYASDVVVADLHDRGSLVRALDGVTAAYFTYPVAAGVVDAAANFAAAAREVGSPRVVVMSMAAASPSSPSRLGRAQWLAEEIFAWAGVPTVALRIAAFFFENLELLHGREIREEGVIRNSFGPAAVSWIAGEDAARLAVAALMHPTQFSDPCVYPTGVSVASHAQIAALLSKQTGRSIRHETISARAWQADLEKRSAVDPRVNAAMAQHIATLASAINSDQRPNSLASSLLDQPPLSIEEAITSGELRIA